MHANAALSLTQNRQSPAYEFGEIGGDVDRAPQRSCARARRCGAPRCGRPGMMPAGPGKAPSTGRLCRTDGGSDPPARQGPRTGGCAHGRGGGTGGGVSGSIPIDDQPEDREGERDHRDRHAGAGMFAKAQPAPPCRSARSAISTLVRLPRQQQIAGQASTAAPAHTAPIGGGSRPDLQQQHRRRHAADRVAGDER